MSSLLAKGKTPEQEALHKAREEQLLIERQRIKGKMKDLAVHYTFQGRTLRHLSYLAEVLHDPVGVIKFHIDFVSRQVNTYYIDPKIEDPKNSDIRCGRADLSEIGLDTLPRNCQGMMFRNWDLEFVAYCCKKFQRRTVSARQIFFELMMHGLTDYEVFVHAGRAVWTNGQGQSFVEVFPTPESEPNRRGWSFLDTTGPVKTDPESFSRKKSRTFKELFASMRSKKDAVAQSTEEEAAEDTSAEKLVSDKDKEGTKAEVVEVKDSEKENTPTQATEGVNLIEALRDECERLERFEFAPELHM